MPATVERAIGSEQLIIETGRLAMQAHGAVTVRLGETLVLATAVMSDKPRSAEVDFLPLTVDFEERLYAAGKIPGSFFRREGRPGQEATLASRLTDRSIRPLFPKGLHNDIQITITILSADKEHPPEILGMVGASAALSLSQIPFDGPIGACRLAYNQGRYTINPTYEEDSNAQLSMVVASTSEAIMMVEAGSDEVSEEVILEGIRQAHQANLVTIDLIEELTSQAGKPKLELPETSGSAAVLNREINAILNGRLSALLNEPGQGRPRGRGSPA
jgi:polyribonucleotide nucleotidyltransferase